MPEDVWRHALSLVCLGGHTLDAIRHGLSGRAVLGIVAEEVPEPPERP